MTKIAKITVGVIGSRKFEPKVDEIAQELGKKLAKMGVNLVCGGLSGVMEAVCKGFKQAQGGISIGILPGEHKSEANKYVDIAIPTGIGLARNSIVVRSADIVVALPGEYGTLSEIAYALHFKKAVIGIGTWNIKGIIQVKTVKEAIINLKKCVAPRDLSCRCK